MSQELINNVAEGFIKGYAAAGCCAIDSGVEYETYTLAELVEMR